MPYQSVILRPGIDVQKSLSLDEAAMARSNLVRFKLGLVQKLGGWADYITAVSTSPVRDLVVFESLRNLSFVGLAAAGKLAVISSAPVLTQITPISTDANPAPNLSVSSGSNLVTIIDPNSSGWLISSQGALGAIRFNTPVALSNLLLNGIYPVQAYNAPGGSSMAQYTIAASTIANTTVTSSGILPIFEMTGGLSQAVLLLPNHNFVAGNFYQFEAPTTIGTFTAQGPLLINAILDSTTVFVQLTFQATGSFNVTMNSGNVGLRRYPPYTGNSGTAASTVASSDWTVDNDWTTLVANPRGDAIYSWSPDGQNGQSNLAQVIAGGGAPTKVNGIFVSQPQQMLVAWGAQSLTTGIQDPLLIRWSDGANFNQWTPTTQNQAGSFRIPTGSVIRGGLQAQLYMVFWTDIDLWIAQYVGLPVVWQFTNFATGCGLVGPHAAGILGGTCYWMSLNNFFMLGPNGVQPMPCPVWDVVFQQIDTVNISKVLCAPNSAFNEVTWYFPLAGGSGENSTYVKVHIEGGEYEWDYGTLGRSAWSDISVIGQPVGTDPSTFNLVQHETSPDAEGAAINAFVETGWFAIGDGKVFSFVDFVIPDFEWATFGSSSTATISMTFYAVDFPGDTARTYGPFNVTKNTEYITPRIRGRLMRMRFESNDTGSFWRIGRIRYRWAPSGER